MDNARIEADVTTQGDGGGIVFRSGYRLRIGTDGSYDLVSSAGMLRNGTSSAIRTGNNVSNHVTIVAQGNRITITINGQVLINITDSSSSSGGLGVMAVNFGNSTTATCNFNLYKV